MEAPRETNPDLATPEPASSLEPRLIVGVGASAGGLESLERLFTNMPTDTGAAFVILQHLSPDFESHLDELLARHTDIPIEVAQDGLEVEPDHIYLLPPAKDMIFSEGKLLLSDREPERGFTLPIDHFLRSLAHEAGNRAVAIILSGTGSDGSRGIRDIHQEGGLVLVEDPASARFDGMPRSAMQTGIVDRVLIAREMAGAILDHRVRLDDLGPDPVDAPEIQGPLERVYQCLRQVYDLDFEQYKPSTILRRLERRLSLTGFPDLESYVSHVEATPRELESLYRDLLIGVTGFFRDAEAFTILEREVLPALVATKDPKEGIRLWVAACATGEEAYSIAILLHELLGERARTVKIFATDVDRGSLEIANAGAFGAEEVAHLSEERRDRYFIRQNDVYTVIPEIRRMIVFAPHNILENAPFTRLDMVSCRNLLIYFTAPAQKKVLSLFHFALRMNGVMMLGPSESPGELGEEFDIVDRKWKVYRKRRNVRLAPETRLPLGTRRLPARGRTPALSQLRSAGESQWLRIYDRLLDRYIPPALLIDDKQVLLHAFGGAEKYLKVQSGRASNNILRMVHDDLKTPVSGAIQQAMRDGRLVSFTGVKVAIDGKEQILRLTAEPFHDDATDHKYLLLGLEPSSGDHPAQAPDALVDMEKLSREYIDSLEAELRFTRESLQATIEELETSNEELQATNEEMVSANEELQSTNEELHSVNQELYTVNAEHQRKIEELLEMSDDMDNLLHSTDLGVIFLDSDLLIRKFTRPMQDVFRLLPRDIGRSFEGFARNIPDDAILDDIRHVLITGERRDRDVTDGTGRSFLMRILPYTGKSTLRGVVVTLVDVTALKREEAEVRRLSGIVEASTDAIVAMDPSGRITHWSPGAGQLLGLPRDEMVGTLLSDRLSPEQKTTFEAMRRNVLEGDPGRSIEVTWHGPDDLSLDLSLSLFVTRDPNGKVLGLATIMRDITQRLVHERKIKQAVIQREQFIALLSHELRNPMAAILNGTRILEIDTQGNARGEAIKIIRRQSLHMARILEDILDVSRVRQGKVEMRRDFLDLRTTVDTVRESVGPSLTESNIQLVTDVSPVPLHVLGDLDRLQQIQVNLIGNAARYSPPGSEIHWSIVRDGSHAVIRVRDQGHGIPPERLEEIFEPFVQVEDKRGFSRGLGLGLALVKSLVNAHGGTVEAHSNGTGQGSEFIVRFPLRISPEEISNPISLPLANRPARTIVLVEDDQDVGATLKHFLQEQGFEVTLVNSGREGLEAIRRVCPDVAIMDIGLPDMTGDLVARALRDSHCGEKPVPALVALTGYGQEQDRIRIKAAGFDLHLVKPVDLDLLLKILRGEEANQPMSTRTQSDASETRLIG